MTNEHDVIVHPGIGLDVTGQAPERACIKIIDEMLAAANRYDFARIKKLHWPFMIPSKSMVEQIKAKVGENKPVEKIEAGRALPERGLLVCPLRHQGSRQQDQTGDGADQVLRVRRAEYCLIAWPD